MSFFILISKSRLFHKRMVSWFFFGVVFLGFLGASISFVVDVEEIYLKKYLAENQLSGYVSDLLESEHGLAYSSVERGVKYQLALSSDAACYALGSSRAMQISLREESWVSNLCPSLANLGVSGGSIEDMVIFSSVLDDREERTIFFVVDPWMLKFNSDVRWMSREEVYNDFAATLNQSIGGGEDFFIRKALNLVNYDYIRASFELMMDQGWSSFPSAGARLANSASAFDWRQGYSQAVTLPDGSHVYAKSYIDGAEERDLVNGGYRNYRIDHYHVDTDAVELLRSLFERMGLRNNLYVVLAPFHPIAFDSRSDEFYEKIVRMEGEIRRVAEDLGIEVMGSYDPSFVGCEEDDFLDAIHPLFGCIERIGNGIINHH